MAKVLLLSATPADDQSEYNLAPLQALQSSAEKDPFHLHQLTADAASAELILFAEFYGGGFHFERIRAHPLVKRYREKCFLFCSNAFVIPFLPGIYASVERRWASDRTCGGFYLGLPESEFATFTTPDHDLPYLFSFMGSTANAPVRRELATLSHPRRFFQDTAAEYRRLLHYEMPPEQRRDYYRRYADTTKASKFVLCPRGLGVATMRLFETMRMGRVPVILSDGWVAPPGPQWEQFSIRIPERDVHNIPQLLEAKEHLAVEMGQRAAAEWEQWFSHDVAFHRVIENCLAIKQRRTLPETVGRLSAYLHYARPFHFRRLMRRKADAMRARFGRADVGRESVREKSASQLN